MKRKLAYLLVICSFIWIFNNSDTTHDADTTLHQDTQVRIFSGHGTGQET